MCPQFVDFNADGHTDIITATYAGSPFVVFGGPSGWQQPQHVVDENDQPIRLAIYWDTAASRWSNVDGSAMGTYEPEGHCISAAVFDWDADGDFDLLVGSYGGLLYLHRNLGEVGKPKFAARNEPVMVGGEPFKLEGGLTAPRLVDWDNDGLTDIVTGGFKGGIYLYRNGGTVGDPKFQPATTLVPGDAGAPGPSSGIYVDPVDYDNDGDLDLLAGGYTTWNPEQPTLTEAQRARVSEINAELQSVQELIAKAYESLPKELEAAKTPEEQAAVYERIQSREDVKAANAKYMALYQELEKLQPSAQRKAGVWLYRRQ